MSRGWDRERWSAATLGEDSFGRRKTNSSSLHTHRLKKEHFHQRKNKECSFGFTTVTWLHIRVKCHNTRSANESPTHWVCAMCFEKKNAGKYIQPFFQRNSLWMWKQYPPEAERAVERQFVYGCLTIVMGCWIWHGAGTLWHDGVLCKITSVQVTDNAARHVISFLKLNVFLETQNVHENSLFLLCGCGFSAGLWLPVWHPRWTVLLLFGTFRSDSECLYRAPVKMAFICFLWAASSCSQGQPAMLDHKYAQCYTLLRKHNCYSRYWLTSALVLGARPALRCTTGGFSPVSRGKARDNFPVSSCRGHSLALSY